MIRGENFQLVYCTNLPLWQSSKVLQHSTERLQGLSESWVPLCRVPCAPDVVCSKPTIPERSFEAVRHDLENVIVLLRKPSAEHNTRLRLLRQLRALLEEADRLMASEALDIGA